MTLVTLHLPYDLWLIESLRDDPAIHQGVFMVDAAALTASFPDALIERAIDCLKIIADGCEEQDSPRSVAFVQGVITGLEAKAVRAMPTKRVPFVCLRCTAHEDAAEVLKMVLAEGIEAEQHGREVRVYPEDFSTYDLRFLRSAVKHTDIFEVRA